MAPRHRIPSDEVQNQQGKFFLFTQSWLKRLWLRKNVRTKVTATSSQQVRRRCGQEKKIVKSATDGFLEVVCVKFVFKDGCKASFESQCCDICKNEPNTEIFILSYNLRLQTSPAEVPAQKVRRSVKRRHRVAYFVWNNFLSQLLIVCFGACKTALGCVCIVPFVVTCIVSDPVDAATKDGRKSSETEPSQEAGKDRVCVI